MRGDTCYGCNCEQVAVAGLVDGAEVPEDDAALLVSIVAGAFAVEPNAAEQARASVKERPSRRGAYAV